MWLPGCFPGARQLDSAHCQGRQFAPAINREPLFASHNFVVFFHAERSALCTSLQITCLPLVMTRTGTNFINVRFAAERPSAAFCLSPLAHYPQNQQHLCFVQGYNIRQLITASEQHRASQKQRSAPPQTE